jgi:RimJ/RimL family protein N-acetyltransferase
MSFRKITGRDQDDIFRITSNPDTMKYVGSSRVWTRQNVENFVEYVGRENVYYFALVTTEVIGFVGLHEHRFVKNDPILLKKMFITSVVRADEQGKGYGTKMVDYILKFGFETLNLSAIYTAIDTENTISKSMFIKKFGARFHAYSDVTKTVIYIITPKFLTYRFSCDKKFKWGILFNHLLNMRPTWIESVNKIVTLSDSNANSHAKSYVDGDTMMTLKHNLYTLTKDDTFTPTTTIIENGKILSPEILSDGTWFLKPSDMLTGAGEGITVINNPSEEKIIPFISKYPIWVLQKEVDNRDIIHDMYYVVRYYCTVVYGVTTYDIYGSNIAKVILHKKDEPISHLKSGVRILHGENLYYKNMTHDIVIKNNYEKFHEICRIVLDKLSNMLKPNGSIGYNVYGFDFIVQKNNNVMLLEVNDHAQLIFDDDEQERNISHVILNNVIDKLEEIIINKKYTPVDSTLLKSGFFLNMNTKFVRRYN